MKIFPSLLFTSWLNNPSCGCLRGFIYFLCLFRFLSSETAFSIEPPLRVRIVGEINNKGLSRDIDILKREIQSLGHSVDSADYYQLRKKKPGDQAVDVADIQIIVQDISENVLFFGKKNYFIPNPEFCAATLQLLRKVDLILARTHEVERIFSALNLPVFFLGFISQDRKVEGVEKNFGQFMHIKGSSPMKGTEELLKGWHKSFPKLILIDHKPSSKKVPKNVQLIPFFLEDDILRNLQNVSGVHLCPSKTEGFGHYLVEAMSAGSAVITVDAPPMNEFITDQDFLIPPARHYVQNYAKVYSISAEDVTRTMKRVLAMDPIRLKEQGAANRERFESMLKEFRLNIKTLMTISSL